MILVGGAGVSDEELGIQTGHATFALRRWRWRHWWILTWFGWVQCLFSLVWILGQGLFRTWRCCCCCNTCCRCLGPFRSNHYSGPCGAASPRLMFKRKEMSKCIGICNKKKGSEIKWTSLELCLLLIINVYYYIMRIIRVKIIWHQTRRTVATVVV